jgi:hypothetical protein
VRITLTALRRLEAKKYLVNRIAGGVYAAMLANVLALPTGKQLAAEDNMQDDRQNPTFLFKHEFDALLEALRRDYRSERDQACSSDEWSDYHWCNVRQTTRLLELLSPEQPEKKQDEGAEPYTHEIRLVLDRDYSLPAEIKAAFIPHSGCV